MAGSPLSLTDLSPRRRRARFRAWHRGMREMDLLLGPFADAKIATLSEAELDDLEALMEAPDGDLFNWLSGAAPTPEACDTPMLRAILHFHRHDKAFDF
jgi:antitoxin CptB